MNKEFEKQINEANLDFTKKMIEKEKYIAEIKLNLEKMNEVKEHKYAVKQKESMELQLQHLIKENEKLTKQITQLNNDINNFKKKIKEAEQSQSSIIIKVKI